MLPRPDRDLSRLVRAVRRTWRDRADRCPVCGTRVRLDDEAIVYRGRRYHRDPCSIYARYKS